MNKKTRALIGGAGVSAVVAAVTLTGGTSAYFYDHEGIAGNSATACGFDLELHSTWQGVAGNNGSVAVSPTGTMTITDLEPGDVFQGLIQVTNDGPCDGDLWADVDYLDNGTGPLDKENSVLDPEVEDGDDPTSAAGELSAAMDVTINGVTYDGDDLAYAFPALLDDSFGQGTLDLNIEITVPEGALGEYNDIMTDSVVYDLDFAIFQDGVRSPSDTSRIG